MDLLQVVGDHYKKVKVNYISRNTIQDTNGVISVDILDDHRDYLYEERVVILPSLLCNLGSSCMRLNLDLKQTKYLITMDCIFTRFKTSLPNRLITLRLASNYIQCVKKTHELHKNEKSKTKTIIPRTTLELDISYNNIIDLPKGHFIDLAVVSFSTLIETKQRESLICLARAISEFPNIKSAVKSLVDLLLYTPTTNPMESDYSVLWVGGGSFYNILIRLPSNRHGRMQPMNSRNFIKTVKGNPGITMTELETLINNEINSDSD